MPPVECLAGWFRYVRYLRRSLFPVSFLNLFLKSLSREIFPAEKGYKRSSLRDLPKNWTLKINWKRFRCVHCNVRRLAVGLVDAMKWICIFLIDWCSFWQSSYCEFDRQTYRLTVLWFFNSRNFTHNSSNFSSNNLSNNYIALLTVYTTIRTTWTLRTSDPEKERKSTLSNG